LAFAHSLIGTTKIYLGHAEETEADVQKALRISPRDSNTYHWTSHAGRAKFVLGCDEEAVGWYQRSIEANPNFSVVRFLLAGALAQLGRLDEAQAATRAGRALDPNFTIRGYRAVLTGLSAHPSVAAQSERLCDGMRKAGVPEG
jgi:tetratricopeptide (TPR) repeat protein